MNNDRKTLIRLAASRPVGDPVRRVLLAELRMDKTATSKFPRVQKVVGKKPHAWAHIEKDMAKAGRFESSKLLLKIVTEMEKRMGSGKKRTKKEMQVLSYLSHLWSKKSTRQNIRSMANLLRIPVPDSLYPSGK